MEKSNNFELHQLGTTKEIKLCRELVVDMLQLSKQYGYGIFPESVAKKLDNIVKYYAEIVENERYENGI